ncbi:MAG: thiolase family protein [Deltaproteobacteria bacterium]|nr:thiolase family protein [Deltaproteobacteria bacterium]MBW2398627.1 thiolase family protein [Deltaproteobacteria bacterium]MBW2667549.1 thiolase family protein [Deltaproteobacteria bacterium]
MKLNATIAGVGMTRFMKYPDKGLKELGAEAINAAVSDAGISMADVESAFVGNCAAGLVTGQESVRGQVILHAMGVGKIPIINVENACASGSTALIQACTMVSAGLYDTVLALGVEKLSHEDKSKSFAAFAGAMDIDELQEMIEELKRAAEADGADAGAGQNRSMFMDVYASAARAHMANYGTTAEQFAMVASKNSFHGSLNPRAQFQQELSVEEVLNERMIVEPLTRAMCSPIGDGAAAAVVVSEKKARELGITKPVTIASSVMHSGYNHADDEPDTVQLSSREAYEEAGLGPQDIDVVEVHDASAPAEIIAYEQLGLCAPGEGGAHVASGASRLGGRQPVNTSGGLLRKGHPVGATGLAQIVELTEQLQGRSGKRQVEGARIAMAQNGGGKKGNDAAAMVVTILRS